MKGRQTYRLSLVTPARRFERQPTKQDKTNQRLRAMAERLKGCGRSLAKPTPTTPNARE